jgi:hypothetical protein
VPGVDSSWTGNLKVHPGGPGPNSGCQCQWSARWSRVEAAALESIRLSHRPAGPHGRAEQQAGSPTVRRRPGRAAGARPGPARRRSGAAAVRLVLVVRRRPGPPDGPSPPGRAGRGPPQARGAGAGAGQPLAGSDRRGRPYAHWPLARDTTGARPPPPPPHRAVHCGSLSASLRRSAEAQAGSLSAALSATVTLSRPPRPVLPAPGWSLCTARASESGRLKTGSEIK